MRSLENNKKSDIIVFSERYPQVFSKTSNALVTTRFPSLLYVPGESFVKEIDPNESEQLRNLFSNQSEKRYVSRLMKKDQKSI